MRIEMFMKPGCKPVKATFTQAAGYRIDKVKWKFIVYREDGSEYRFTHNFDDVARLFIDGREIPQCYWYDHEIYKEDIERDARREQVRKFVKDEIVKELTDMTHAEVIKNTINNLYGIKMTDDEIKYCEADVRFVLDAYKKNKERINEYITKNNTWNLYYTRTDSDKDTVLIAQNFDDAVAFCKEANFSVPIYIGDADSRDKYFKEDGDDCSILTVTECTDGMPCLATKKYVAEIDRIKEEIKMIHLITGYNNEEKENNAIKNNTWNLYYTRTDSAQQDRVIIAKSVEEAIEYAKKRYIGCSEPVWFAEADEHDKNVRANNSTPSTLWDTHKGDGLIISAVEKYGDKIKQIKHELGIAPTGSIEVRYYKNYTRKFENVVKYEEGTPWGIKTLFITDSTGRHINIPMASIKEYVVDMPNDKKVVKEQITLDKEELESILAEMRALEEKLKKIKEEG